jgi:hypothetical protein
LAKPTARAWCASTESHPPPPGMNSSRLFATAGTRRRQISIIAVLLACLLVFSGCASTSSTSVPGADIASVKKIHVVKLAKDERGVNQLFADQLALRGYQVTTGEAAEVPPDADAILTYQDKWMWDITMYMVEINAQLRRPKTEMMMVNARSFRPSLQRKSPPEMVREVLATMFTKKP